ncbi:hypothetical protein L543_3218 [Bordetella hinzii L60]|nr:hypothetical protein L543_3218 [Bordetella hinzii L60]
MPDVFVDGHGPRVGQQDAAQDADHGGHHDRIHQAAEHIAAGLGQIGGGKGHDAAEDARPDVIRKGQRRIADARREEFHQIGRHRAVDHGHDGGHQDQDGDDGQAVDARRIGGLGIVRLGQGLAIGRGVKARHRRAAHRHGDGLARQGRHVLEIDAARHEEFLGLDAGLFMIGVRADQRGLQAEVAGAITGVGMDAHRRAAHGLGQRRIAGLQQGRKHGVVAHGRREQARHHQPFAADAVGQPAKEDKGGRADGKADDQEQVDLLLAHLHGLLQEDHHVELAREIGRALAGGHPHQRDQHQTKVGPLPEGLLDRIARQAVLLLHAGEDGRLMQLRADIDRDGQHHDGQQKGHAPTPLAEVVRAHAGLGGDDDQQRENQAGRRRDLDPAGEQAAAPGLAMLGDIDHRAAVFAAHGQALDDAQRQQQDPRQVAGAFIAGQAADQDGRAPHHDHGDQKGVLAAQAVAEIAEQHRPQRPDDKAHRQRAQCGQQGDGGIVLRKKHLAHEDGQRAIDEKVVPLEQRPDRGRHDHLALFLAAERQRRHGGAGRGI